jgi:hypothetical protein
MNEIFGESEPSANIILPKSSIGERDPQGIASMNGIFRIALVSEIFREFELVSARDLAQLTAQFRELRLKRLLLKSKSENAKRLY